jgi:hypothetical protein
VGKIKTSIEADVSLTLVKSKQRYIATTKPLLRHVETALVLVRLKSETENVDSYKNTGLFVYGKEGSDIYKITL